MTNNDYLKGLGDLVKKGLEEIKESPVTKEAQGLVSNVLEDERLQNVKDLSDKLGEGYKVAKKTDKLPFFTAGAQYEQGDTSGAVAFLFGALANRTAKAGVSVVTSGAKATQEIAANQKTKFDIGYANQEMSDKGEELPYGKTLEELNKANAGPGYSLGKATFDAKRTIIQSATGVLADANSGLKEVNKVLDKYNQK